MGKNWKGLHYFSFNQTITSIPQLSLHSQSSPTYNNDPFLSVCQTSTRLSMVNPLI